MSQRLTGKASYVSIAGTKFGTKKITPKTTRKLADSTDSTDYDSGTDLLWPTQLAVMAPVELSVEGNYNLTTTPAQLIANLYSGVAAVAVVIALNATTIYGHGNFDISDFQTDAPVDDIVTFSCTMKSNGVFTSGS